MFDGIRIQPQAVGRSCAEAKVAEPDDADEYEESGDGDQHVDENLQGVIEVPPHVARFFVRIIDVLSRRRRKQKLLQYLV